MKIRTYYILSLLIIFILAFSGLAVYKYTTRKGMLGSYVFADTIPHMDKMAHIAVVRADGQINLELDDSLWRVKEAGGYYANYTLLNSLFTDIYNSRYNSLVESAPDGLFSEQVILSFADDKGHVLDEIILGRKDDNYLYTFSRRGKETFLISGKFILPPDVVSWIQAPAFAFDEDEVMSIAVVEKSGKTREISIRNTPLSLRDYLGFPYFKNAVAAKEFSRDDTGEERRFIVTSYNGLRAEFSIIPRGGTYWGQLNIGTTKMPTLEVSDYVKNNAFLYDGWYFELPKDYGEMVYRFLGAGQ